MSIPTGELCDRYGALYTGVVADTLDDHGYQDQVLAPGLAPLEEGMAAAGVAYPAVGRPNRSADYDEQMRRFLRMLGKAPEHGLLVLATSDDESAQIGELSTLALAKRGCRGAVIDGGARDVDGIVDQGFPTFARYRSPADSVPRWELVEYDATAVVGGVRVAPGDVVVADRDGVVVVPQSVAEDVLAAAEAMVRDEDAVRAAVADGADPLAAYEEHGTF